MIKEIDGDHYEDMRSIEQNLTFKHIEKIFNKCNVEFGKNQMKTLGIMNSDEIYTNLGMHLSDQCKHTIKVASFNEKNKMNLEIEKKYQVQYYIK